jgi:hypothetical protein
MAAAAIIGFSIYRGNASGSEVLIGTVDGGLIRTFTDLNAPSDVLYYRVAALDATSSVAGSSVSLEVAVEKVRSSDQTMPLVILGITAIAAILVAAFVWKRRRT